MHADLLVWHTPGQCSTVVVSCAFWTTATFLGSDKEDYYPLTSSNLIFQMSPLDFFPEKLIEIQV